MTLGQRVGLLVANHPISQRNLGGENLKMHKNDYEDAYGLIKQCGHCRKIFNHQKQNWEWQPSIINDLSLKISHGLCTECLPLYSADIPNYLLQSNTRRDDSQKTTSVL
jgi:hypothetical protein